MLFLYLISGNLLPALEDIMLFCDFYMFLIDTLQVLLTIRKYVFMHA